MKLIDFPKAFIVIAKDQPEYMPMFAHVDKDSVVTCCWKLTFRERLSLLFNGKLWHRILTFGDALQPQMLSVYQPPMYMTLSDELMRKENIV